MSSKQVEKLLSNLGSLGIEPNLTEDSYERIIKAGFRGENQTLATIAAQILVDVNPISLRGLFYKIVSTGFFPSTDKTYYDRLGRLVTSLRRSGIIRYSWIVDGMRSTLRPSSWSGIGDYLDTVRDAYRKDYWSNLPDYVHIFAEKDAIAGTIEPVTREYDVALSPIRGYCSESFAWKIAEEWKQIKKPIHVGYLGDFDPSGFDIERDLKHKLESLSGVEISWRRLGITAKDFSEFSLIPLKPKQSDNRYQKFIEEHGYQCAEIDALSPEILRERVRSFIGEHIDWDAWQLLQRTEEIEKESFENFIGGFKEVQR
jgi:hypothetical protein